MGGKPFYGWAIVGVVFLLTFIYQIQYTFGIFLEPMVEQFGWSRGSASGVYSMGIFILMPMGIFWGRILDKHNPGRLFLVSCTMGGLGLFLSSFIFNLWQFYITFGLLWGIGWSSLFITSTTLVRKWFITKSGLAMGISVSGISIGWAVIMPVTGHIITNTGWQDAFRFLGILVWIVGIIAGILLKSPPENKIKEPDKKVQSPLPSKDNSTSLPGYEDWEVGEALRSPSFWMMWLSMFLILMVIFIITSHGVGFVIGQGIPRETVAYVFGIMGLISISGRLGSGWFADYLIRKGVNTVHSRRYMLSLSSALMGVGGIILVTTTSSIQLWIWAFVFGIGYGIHVPQFTTIMGDMFGMKNLGMLTSLTGLAGGMAGVIGPVLTGVFYDYMGNYMLAYKLVIIISFLGAIVSLLIRVPEKKVIKVLNYYA